MTLNREQITKALKCHADESNSCGICPYKEKGCSLKLARDAAIVIEKLQAERDLAVQDLHTNTKCHICKHLPSDGNMTHCPKYASCGLGYIHFE